MKNMPKVTIVIPVYKVGKYIENSMKSVIAQRFTDFEVVLVDNNTPDDSIEIAERVLAGTNINYRVVKQTIQGLPAARNKGIEEAKGEWIVSIDPDDTISSYFLEELYNTAISNNLEIVISKYAEVTEKDLFCFPQETEQGKVELYEQKEILPLLLTRKMPLMISNTFFKKDLFVRNGFQFDIRVKMGSDLVQMWDFLLSVPRMGFINKYLYNHFFRPDSIITAPSAEKVITNRDCYLRLRDRMVNKYGINQQFADWVYARAVFAAVGQSSMWGNFKIFNNVYKKVYDKEVYSILKTFPQKKLTIMNTIVHVSPRLFHFINKTMRQQDTWIWKVLSKFIYR